MKFKDIASKVGLDHLKFGSDIASFPITRARLPDDVFWAILKDLQCVTRQYGTLDEHRNEEARSRYISAVCGHLSSISRLTDILHVNLSLPV